MVLSRLILKFLRFRVSSISTHSSWRSSGSTFSAVSSWRSDCGHKSSSRTELLGSALGRVSLRPVSGVDVGKIEGKRINRFHNTTKNCNLSSEIISLRAFSHQQHSNDSCPEAAALPRPAAEGASS